MKKQEVRLNYDYNGMKNSYVWKCTQTHNHKRKLRIAIIGLVFPETIPDIFSGDGVCIDCINAFISVKNRLTTPLFIPRTLNVATQESVIRLLNAIYPEGIDWK